MSNELLSLSDLALTVKPSLYRHFKGGEYTVLGVGRSSEDPSQEFVIYQSLENNYIWIRPVQMFLEHIERDGYSGPRFTLIQN